MGFSQTVLQGTAGMKSSDAGEELWRMTASLVEMANPGIGITASLTRERDWCWQGFHLDTPVNVENLSFCFKVVPHLLMCQNFIPQIGFVLFPTDTGISGLTIKNDPTLPYHRPCTEFYYTPPKDVIMH